MAPDTQNSRTRRSDKSNHSLSALGRSQDLKVSSQVKVEDEDIQPTVLMRLRLHSSIKMTYIISQTVIDTVFFAVGQFFH